MDELLATHTVLLITVSILNKLIYVIFSCVLSSLLTIYCLTYPNTKIKT